MTLSAFPYDLTSCVFPLVKAKKDLTLGFEFLGTAFMIGPDRFVTARHCLSEVTLGDNQVVAGVFGIYGDEMEVKEACDIVLDEKYDVAHGTVINRSEPKSFLILDSENIILNRDVVTIEYSATQVDFSESAEFRGILFDPIFRKGNMTRFYPTKMGHRFRTNCIGLSFPAMKGASGAPIIYDGTNAVVGMLVKNVELELLPAQVVVSRDESGEVTEERRFFLPSGEALRSEYLVPHLAEG